MANLMKALSFELDGRKTYGLSDGDGIREAGPEFRQRFPDLRSVLGSDSLGELAANCDASLIESAAVRFQPLIPNPDKTICVGVNFRPHVEEMGRDIPDFPVLFARFPGSQVGHREAIVRPLASQQLDFEGELAVVIGRPAFQVAAADANDFVAGYTCFMDGTLRDFQRHTHQFMPGKNFRASGAVGPYLVTADEIADVQSLELTTHVNGECMQRARMSELIFGVAELIEYVTTFTELLPGDIISTGTPGGVAAARTPPTWLRAGDVVEVDLGPVGRLENTVVDEA